MKKQYWVGLVAMVAIAFGVGQAFAQDGEKEKMGADALAHAWRAKTKQHTDMAQSVGEFDVMAEMFMMPGQPPEKAPATAKRELIMNGLYVQETFTMQTPQGPFVGRLTMGYDTVRKQYVNTWIDVQNPVMSVSHGTEKDGVLTFTGEEPDMMTGKLGKTKSTLKVAGPDAWVMSMYRVTEKGDQMTMRLTYTRKK